jgi:hypothetical protein
LQRFGVLWRLMQLRGGDRLFDWLARVGALHISDGADTSAKTDTNV